MIDCHRDLVSQATRQTGTSYGCGNATDSRVNSGGLRLAATTSNMQETIASVLTWLVVTFLQAHNSRFGIAMALAIKNLVTIQVRRLGGFTLAPRRVLWIHIAYIET